MRSIKRVVCAMLLASLLLCAAPGATAAENLCYATTSLYIRSGPDNSYPVIGTLAKGQVVVTVGSAENNWIRILTADNSGAYVSAAFLKPYETGVSSVDESFVLERYYATTGLNVRSGPGTNYAVVYVLKAGDVVIKVGSVGKWTQILMSDGSIAYVSTAYLAKYEESRYPAAAIPNINDVYYQADTGLYIRSGPGTSYEALEGLQKGDIVTKIGLYGQWMEIRLDESGATAYVSAAHLSPVEGLSVVIAIADVNIRSGPGSQYSVLNILRTGDAVVRIGAVDNWAKILMPDNSIAYVSVEYLYTYTPESTGTSQLVTDCYKATTPLNVRSGPGTQYSIIGALDTDQVVTKCGESGDWTQIMTVSGIKAYVFSKYLVPSQPTALAVLTLTTECQRILDNEAKVQQRENKDFVISPNG